MFQELELVPRAANEQLKGTESEQAGKASACAGCANQEICASGKTNGPDPALPFIKQRMANVKRKILVLSGKGGVGKSTFTAQLGWAFAADEQTQVSPILPKYFYSVADRIFTDRHNGRGYLWSFHTDDTRDRFGAGPLLLNGMVSGICTRQPWCHVSRFHASLFPRCGHVARTEEKRIDISIPQGR